MSRAVPAVGIALVLAMTVAATGLAVAQVAGPSPIVAETGAQELPRAPPAGNATERLPVANASAAVAYENASIDPALATSLGFERTAAEFDAYLTREEMLETATPDSQLAFASATIDELRGALDTLYVAERSAYQAFAAGKIDGRTFQTRLVRVHRRAEALDRRADGLRIALGTIDGSDRRAEINIRRGQLRRVQMDARSFHGPVGDRIVASIEGDRSGFDKLWLAGSEHGYEIATIRGSDYTREAYLAPNRDRSGEVVYRNTDEGLSRAGELYPWTYANAIGTESDKSGSLFWSHVEHPHGKTLLYLDAATELSFREANELNVPTLEYRPVGEATAGGVTVRVRRSFPGGPAAVHVVDAENGTARRELPVRINGSRVGTTGADGVLRTIAPKRPATISVAVGETTIEVVVPGPAAAANN